MYVNHQTYQLIKTKKGKEKIVIETEASCLEKAVDYFYTIKPKAYGNSNYRIGIKRREEINVEW